MVFLDLTNAFGCIPHQLLWKGFDSQGSGHSVFSRYSEMTHKESLLDHGTTIFSVFYHDTGDDHSNIQVSGRWRKAMESAIIIIHPLSRAYMRNILPVSCVLVICRS